MVGGRQLGARILRLYLPLGFFLVAMLFPFYWMAITSIKPNRELYNAKIMPLIVHQPVLKHYVDLLDQTNFLTWTYNTLLVAVVTTVVSLVIGTMLAYPLARLNFPGAAIVAIGIAATYLVPQPLLFIPMSDIINMLELGNTLTAVMLTYPTLLIPFCAWLLMGYFKSVPRELEEAARIDGASRWACFWRIILPLSGPALASLAIFAFMFHWNNLLWPLIVSNTDKTIPIVVGLTRFQGEHGTDWQLLMAASVVATIPVLVAYFAAQRWFVQGIATSGFGGR
jgi:multiple sugar transport system permease protein